MKTILKSTPFKALLIAILIINCNKSSAQSKSIKRSEISLSVAPGITKLNYDQKKGGFYTELGAIFSLGYTYNLNDNWALSTGMSYQSSQSSALFQQIENHSDAIDIENEDFEFRYRADKFRENQKINFISIPLTVQYQTKGLVKFYARLGGQLGFATKARYSSKFINLKTSGYYKQYDVELFDPRFMGFGDFDKLQKSGEMEVGMAISAIAEMGVKQSTGRHGDLYFGVFLNYGLNDISDAKKKHKLLEYNQTSPSEFNSNNLFESGLAKDLSPIAYGFKIRYSYSF